MELYNKIDAVALEIENKVIAIRQDIHQHPELAYQEVRTSKLIARHLESLGIEVETGVGRTGVVGVLRGGKEGPVVALRADMDAVPVVEEVDVPYASKVKAVWDGVEVGVMHACGHDAHSSMLLGAAEVLASIKDELPGTVKFIFQPAEEAWDKEDEGGSVLMIRDGVLENPKPEVIYALHAFPYTSNTIYYRSGPLMASADKVFITVNGTQTHSGFPWDGVDAITTASQIVLGLQTLVSRRANLTLGPAILSLTIFHADEGWGTVPGKATIEGVLYTYDNEERFKAHEWVRQGAEKIAESAGATADVRIEVRYPVTVNPPELMQRIIPTLERVAGIENLIDSPLIPAAENFACFQEKIPGILLFLGTKPKDQPAEEAKINHSPSFQIGDENLRLGVRTLANLTLDYMLGK